MGKKSAGVRRGRPKKRKFYGKSPKSSSEAPEVADSTENVSEIDSEISTIRIFY